MAGDPRGARAGGMSDAEDPSDQEVTARKATTIADDLNGRRSGRLKQDGGRLREGTAEAQDGTARLRKAQKKRVLRTEGAEGATADAPENAQDQSSDVTVRARKEAHLADELGVDPSGRLKQGASRLHDGNADAPDAAEPHGRSGKRTSRLRAEAADAPADGKTPGGARGKLRPQKAARHALRFAEDAGAVADAAVMDDGEGDASEDALREGERRMMPAGKRALARGGRKQRTAGAAPAPASQSPATGGSPRLRDGPAFATNAGEPRPPASSRTVRTADGSKIAGFWKQNRWKRAARAEAAARKAAETGETGALSGMAALKAHIQRMFTAGGAGRGAIAVAVAITMAAMFALAALSTCSTVGTAVVQAAAATSYVADDQEMKDADAAYTQMEASLEGEAQSAKSSHPGYDEYRYQIGELGHDPFALASILTARYGDYKASDVTGFLREILAAQYSLTFEESTETEYVTVIDADGYETTQEVTRRILTVRLVNHGLDHAARQLLTPDELASYEATYAAKGNRDDLFPAPYAGNYGSTGAGFDWRPSGEALSDAEFAAMYAEGSKYLGWPYVWGGGSPDTGFDCSGFVSWVLTSTGVCNTGRQITDGLLSYCTQVSREQARPGDLVFFTGTYETDLLTSHVGIYLGDGMMMHCGDPIQITSIDVPYWQAHLYGFGRVK